MAKHEQVETDGTGAMAEGERLFRARALFEAAAACHPEDAEMVMTALLEELLAGPPMPLSDDLQDDADFWAGLASFHELRAYFIASGRKLVRNNLGVRGKVKLARHVMADLQPTDRREALRLMSEDLSAEVAPKA